jgi:hypothetical protein
MVSSRLSSVSQSNTGMKESYNPVIVHIHYRICETLLNNGKNLRTELMAGDYGFENVVNYIKKPKFIDFLRHSGMSVEEFNMDELDFAFKAESEDFYSLSDLLTYFDKMKSTESNSIHEKHNANFKAILEELIDHLVSSTLL